MSRAAHLLMDAEPPIFRDDYALALSGRQPEDALSLLARFPPEVSSVYRVGLVVRARYTEEEVEAAVLDGVTQYVILGAGLDSFAWRRTDLADRLRVFEVDHPGTQAWKLDQLAAAGLVRVDHVVFVPFDFASDDDLGNVLAEAGFRPDRPTIWSWLGVTIYLTTEQVTQNLARLADLSAPGSILITDFIVPRDLMDDVTRLAYDLARPAAAAEDEPLTTSFRPNEIAEIARASGWGQPRTSAPDDFASWFDGRTDSLTPRSHVWLLRAIID